MQASNKREFAGLMEGLCAAFSKDATTALIGIYWSALQDLTIECVKQAINRAVTETKFWPPPAVLRELSGLQVVGNDRAIKAWDAARRAIHRYGYTRSIDFDDPLINATIRSLGGWSKFCWTPQEELDKWGRKDFERIYGSYLRSGTTGEQAGYLPGDFETANSFNAHWIQDTIRIQTGLPELPKGLIQGPREDKPKRVEEKTKEKLKQLTNGLGR